ncbi:unnamed protein product [Mytilus coruscus]|uniref:MEGF10_11 n=1 Tax=Mytilus coruscus TaxID=42192 RepID=A0A6J8DLK1_MYTCO|nr:unnamed protein product [Mytilus coruscus]
MKTFFVTVTAQTNLALEGNVDQKTTLTDSDGVHNAILATTGPANNNWNDGCSSTMPGKKQAWWALLLPKIAFVTNVVIYYRGDRPDQMDQFRLYLSNGTEHAKDKSLCYTDLGIKGYPETTQDHNCNTLTRNVYFFNRDRVVELCYIEINGCWKGTWGDGCTTDCPVECIGRHCYPGNGSCIWGCDVQECFHGTCDAETSICTKGCVPGRGGRYCTFYNTVHDRSAKQRVSGQSSPANVLVDGNTTSCISIVSTGLNPYIQIGNESLIVITGVYLFFGDRNPIVGIHKVYCSNTTDSWVDGLELYNAEYVNKDKNVFAVCKYIIYIPPVLIENAEIDICEIEIRGCPYGKYGDICQSICPDNCIGPCDLITGNCLFGCVDGWRGEKCGKACAVGKFGGQCLRNCSSNCLSSPCDHVTGQCKAGCQKGWEGFNCTEECSTGNFGLHCSETCDGCITNECYHINGDCKNDSVCKPGYVYGKYCNQTCEAWHFGTNCNKMCNCKEKPCNIFTGECPDGGCQMGWKGDSCDQECTRGYFGSNCVEFCNTCSNHSCNKVNGSCDAGCKNGFSGLQCSIKDTQESKAGSGPAIGGGISGVFIVIILVVLAVIIYR